MLGDVYLCSLKLFGVDWGASEIFSGRLLCVHFLFFASFFSLFDVK